MRRLTRKVARMAFEDCFDRSQMEGNREIIDGDEFPKVTRFDQLSTADQ